MNEVNEILDDIPNLGPRNALQAVVQIAKRMAASHAELMEKVAKLEAAANAPIGEAEAPEPETVTDVAAAA